VRELRISSLKGSFFFASGGCLLLEGTEAGAPWMQRR
jgi:hypothetical protein